MPRACAQARGAACIYVRARQDRGQWDRQSVGKAAGSDFSTATRRSETLDTQAPNSECNEPQAFHELHTHKATGSHNHPEKKTLLPHMTDEDSEYSQGKEVAVPGCTPGSGHSQLSRPRYLTSNSTSCGRCRDAVGVGSQGSVWSVTNLGKMLLTGGERVGLQQGL